MFDPWAELKRHPDVKVHIGRLEDGVVGLTDGISRIWLDDRLNQVERRCTLTHELQHLLHGHVGRQPLSVEMRVCQRAARLLITLEDLARVMPWPPCLYEMAEELWVTPQTLRDRLHGLTQYESQLLHSWEMMRAA